MTPGAVIVLQRRARPTVAAFVLLGALGLLLTVGRSAASSTTIYGMFVAALGTALIIGAAWAVASPRRLTCEVDLPSRLQVDVVSPLTIRFTGASRGAWTGWPLTGSWQRVGESGVRPTARGVIRALPFQASALGPLGLARVTIVAAVVLDRPVVIAPRADGESAVQSSARTQGDESLRALRPYLPGDSPRMVHWPTTARAGELMIRDVETDAPSTVVIVDLRLNTPSGAALDTQDHEQVEDAAARAAALVRRLWADGHRVVLGTATVHGPVLREVTGSDELDRRIAEAGPVAPPTVRPGTNVFIVGAASTFAVRG